MESPFKKIAIVGLGLIGGSLAKAARGYFVPPPFIHAIDKNADSLDFALNEKMIDTASVCADKELRDCEVVFISVPVCIIPTIMEDVLRFTPPDCIITDTGSTKETIVRYALNKGINYIGGHPMAGLEYAGYKASKEFLFENAYYILTPAPHIKDEAVVKLTEFLKAIGAYPIIIDESAHDNAVAAISHIPHIVACALVNTVKSLDDEAKTMHTIAAGGFKDLTRIASSGPGMWGDICALNKNKILSNLDAFINTLLGFRKNLDGGADNIEDFFKAAKDYRDSFDITHSGSYLKEYRIFVDVYDKPGVIATIATHLSVNNINIKNIGIINSREYASGALQIVFETADNMERSIKLLKGMNFTVNR